MITTTTITKITITNRRPFHIFFTYTIEWILFINIIIIIIIITIIYRNRCKKKWNGSLASEWIDEGKCNVCLFACLLDSPFHILSILDNTLQTTILLQFNNLVYLINWFFSEKKRTDFFPSFIIMNMIISLQFWTTL